MTPKNEIKLGVHHFGYLSAISQGLSQRESAERYLGIVDSKDAAEVHRKTVDAIRAIGKRLQDSAWRLIGLTIKERVQEHRPSIEQFIEERELEEWSMADAMEMYDEAYGKHQSRGSSRKKLQERQVALLRRIQTEAAEKPSEKDDIWGWFEGSTASRLESAGVITLLDLRKAIASRKNWYEGIEGIGLEKATRIGLQLDRLIGVTEVKSEDFTVKFDSGSESRETVTQVAEAVTPKLKGQKDGFTEDEAIGFWIKVSAKSEKTKLSYKREADRFKLWCLRMKAGVSLSAFNSDDAKAYRDFLSNVDEKWISRKRAKPGEAGWAPFRGKLNAVSVQLAVDVLHSLFGWLVANGVRDSNPWEDLTRKSVKRAVENKKGKTTDGTVKRVKRVQQFLEIEMQSLERDRMAFVLEFVTHCPMRPSDLLKVKLGDFSRHEGGWSLMLSERKEMIDVSEKAMYSVDQYIQRRGMSLSDEDVPLIASSTDVLKGIGYQTLYEQVKIWFKRAGVESNGMTGWWTGKRE